MVIVIGKVMYLDIYTHTKIDDVSLCIMGNIEMHKRHNP